MIRIDNLAQFTRGIEQWIEECEALALKRLHDLAIGAFDFILQGTPQWSGEMVSNWTITLGAPAAGSPFGMFKDEPLGTALPEPYSRQRPNTAALAFARAMSAGALAPLRLQSEIFITNVVPYAQNVETNSDEAGAPFLRPVNLPVEMVHAAVDKFGGIH